MPLSQAELPDAPEPVNFETAHAVAEQSASLSSSFDFIDGALDATRVDVAPTTSESVPLNGCPYDTTRARECRVHWPQLLISSAVFLTFQSTGNLYTGYWYRYETGHGKWFDRWINSAAGWRWDVWDDDNPKMDQYVGHPMMGSITNYLWIQNDPKGMTLDLSNTWPYWRSRLRATAFTTAYSFAWKLGPFGEAGIGHNGDHLVPQGGGKPWSNETGWVELVTTPVGGLLWTMAEDSLDRYVVKKIEEKQRRPATLLLLSFLTPSRATANIFRFRPPWYRDGRQVKANSFWSDPPGPKDEAVRPAEASSVDPPHPRDAMMLDSASGSIRPAAKPQVLPVWPRPGGVHEFGAWWGFSLISGHIWGYADDVKYMPVDVTYSYLINPGGKWNFRYSPEVTVLAMLDWPTPHKNETRFDLRKRSYGSGVSPVGFRASFNPQGRVQPFFSTNGGFIYFMDRVLSPEGSQFMYTIDFGGGVQIFRKERQTVTLGYRYQHLSNGDISHHNPGTDANTFYVAVSRYRTKGYR
ncbi:MAG TPA: acyloxyacyl hydrolase [Terracidiphilus sp.]|nr:acyloxyacyl hydrolase [Terracidiphilus sp.]